MPSTGISSSYLGPVVRVRTGDTIPFRVENRLDEETTLHWHGLLIPSDVDGGPHNTIKPGGVWTPELKIKQPAATTWFHPHPHGNTAKQVYGGLAGMMIVSDGGDRDRGLPETYGVDDLPIVLQDKRFGRNGELVYEPTMMDLMHGFQGDTLLVNGAIAPVAKVPAGFVRLRLLNAANARNFDLRFSDRRPFFVIAGDAGSSRAGGSAKPGDRARRTLRNPGELLRRAAGRSGHGARYAPRNGARHDDADGPARRSGGTRNVHAFQARSRVEGGGHAAAAAAGHACGARHQIGRGVANLRARSDDGNGTGHDGHDGDGIADGPAAVASDAGHDHAAAAQMMGINGRSFDMHRIDVTTKLGTSEIWEIVIDRNGASVPYARRELPHPEQQRHASQAPSNPAGRTSSWWKIMPKSSSASIIPPRRRCRSCITATSSNMRTMG